MARKRFILFIWVAIVIAAGCSDKKGVTPPPSGDKTPPAATTDLIATDTTTSSITLSWTAPGDDDTIGIASEYDIRYSTSEIDTSNWSSATECADEPSPDSAGSAESFVVTGLDPNTIYYFAMRTSDEASNWSEFSNVATETTADNFVITWAKTYGGYSWEDLSQVIVAPDGGYVAVGQSWSFYGDVYVLKVDEYGNKVWDGDFHGTASSDPLSVAATPDGGYIVAGYTGCAGDFLTDVCLLKIDGSGNEIWWKTFGKPIWEDMAWSVAVTPDGGYIAAGWSYNYYDTTGIPFPGGLYLLKVDDSGDMIWEKTYDNGGGAFSVAVTPDGGYIVSGDAATGLVKVDSLGNEIWDLTLYPSMGCGESVIIAPDGCYVVAGFTPLMDTLGLDFYLAKVDESGNLIWEKTYGGADIDFAMSVAVAPDGGYIIGAKTMSFGAGAGDYYLIKTDENGDL